MRARIFGVFLIAWVAIAAASALRAQPAPGPGGGDGGPYCHQVREAESTDGATFRAKDGVVLDRASVPDAVRWQDRIHLYFVNGEAGAHGIWLAKPTGASGVLAKRRVLLDGRFVGDAVDPDVVRVSAEGLRMFYFLGHFVSGGGPRQRLHPIYGAVSDDGVNFRVEGKVIEVADVTDPSVVRLASGRWLMALARPQAFEILIAESADGRTFALNGVRLAGGIPELAVGGDGAVRLFFNDRGGIASYLSEDEGRTWRRERGLRLAASRLVADPSVVVGADRAWTLFFKTVDPDCRPPTRGRGR